MPFIRVKSPVTGHQFDVDPRRLAAHPEWVVVDAEPVKVARPADHGKPGKVKRTITESTFTNPTARVIEETEPTDTPSFSESSAPETD